MPPCSLHQSTNALAVSNISLLRPVEALVRDGRDLDLRVGDALLGRAAGVALLAHRLEVAEATLVERGRLSAAVAAAIVGRRLAAVVFGARPAVVTGAGRARQQQEGEQRSAGSGVLQVVPPGMWRVRWCDGWCER